MSTRRVGADEICAPLTNGAAQRSRGRAAQTLPRGSARARAEGERARRRCFPVGCGLRRRRSGGWMWGMDVGRWKASRYAVKGAASQRGNPRVKGAGRPTERAGPPSRGHAAPRGRAGGGAIGAELDRAGMGEGAGRGAVRPRGRKGGASREAGHARIVRGKARETSNRAARAPLARHADVSHRAGRARARAPATATFHRRAAAAVRASGMSRSAAVPPPLPAPPPRARARAPASLSAGGAARVTALLRKSG